LRPKIKVLYGNEAVSGALSPTCSRNRMDLNMPDKLMNAQVLLTFALSASALAGDSVKINDLVIAGQIPAVRREATVKALRAFYDFWNTGDAALLKQAIAENFTAPCRRDVRRDRRARPLPRASSGLPCPTSG
jgi:hypothetical protein